MEDYKSVAIDLAKRIFHIVALDQTGKVSLKKKLPRDEVLSFCLSHFKKGQKIAMEACGGCHFWGQELMKLGFEVILLKPSDVKPYCKSRQKNDTNDAIGIAKASLDVELRHVSVKSVESQEMLLLHRIRENTIRARIRKTNSLLSMLHEFGYITSCSSAVLKSSIKAIIDHAHKEGFIRRSTHEVLMEEAEAILALLQKEKDIEKKIAKLASKDERAKLLKTIPGIGLITSSVTSALPIESYSNPREFAASIGLVPSQHSTGGNIVLGNISKKGNRYVRKMLIQGARTILMGESKGRCKGDKMISWAYQKRHQKGFNTASVALANKLARVMYACVVNQTPYEAKAS
jgi:transposase